MPLLLQAHWLFQHIQLRWCRRREHRFTGESEKAGIKNTYGIQIALC